MSQEYSMSEACNSNLKWISKLVCLIHLMIKLTLVCFDLNSIFNLIYIWSDLVSSFFLLPCVLTFFRSIISFFLLPFPFYFPCDIHLSFPRFQIHKIHTLFYIQIKLWTWIRVFPFKCVSLATIGPSHWRLGSNLENVILRSNAKL